MPAEDRIVLSLLSTMPGPALISGIASRKTSDAAAENGGGRGLIYRFLLDRFGMNEAERNTVVLGEQIPGDLAQEAAALVELIQAFGDVMRQFEVKPADLTAVGVLSRALAWREVERASGAAAAAVRTDVATGTLLADMQTLRGARGLIQAHAAVLCRLLPLAAYVRHHAAFGTNWDSNTSVIVTMDRLLQLETIAPSALDLLLGQAYGTPVPNFDDDSFATREDIRGWEEKIRILQSDAGLKIAFKQRIASSWSRWDFGLRWEAVDRRAPNLFDINLDDLILDAAGEAPGRLLVRTGPLPAWSWSELALEGALTAAGSDKQAAQNPAPLWALLAGLRAQGFDRERLLDLRSRFGPHDPAEPMAGWMDRLVEGAIPAPPGILCVVTNKFEPGILPTPCIILQTSDLNRYRAATAWLIEHHVIEDMSRGQTS